MPSGAIVGVVLHTFAPRAVRRPALTTLGSALAAAALLFALTGTTALGATTMAAKCDYVNLRTGASTTYAIKASVLTGTTISVVATVTGGSWSATCAGAAVSGSGWFQISAVNGTAVSTLYGVTYVYGATGLFKAVATSTPTASATTSPTPTPTAAPTAPPTAAPTTVATPTVAPTPAPTVASTPAPTAAPTVAPIPTPTPSATSALAATCSSVNLRASASTSAVILASVPAGTTIVTSTTVSGGSWSTDCAGLTVAGSTWYRITAVNRTSVASLYGATYAYAATGLFHTVTIGAPAPIPSTASVLGPSITFYGRGNGHGVGLSQYGALGRATAGQGYLPILAHYYPGTTAGTMPNSTIRVLVLSGWAASASSPLRLYGRGGTWTIDGIATVFPADAQVQLLPTVNGTDTTWRLTVYSSLGSVLYSAASSGSLVMRPASSSSVLQLYSKPSYYDHYRGILRITATTTISVVNELAIETYLRGVVPTEMPASWPGEALKSQAVAARSYAAYHLRPGVSTFDVYDDTRSQVYRGLLSEQAATNTAILATAGVVLRSGTAIADTLFHSAGGGATEDNQYAFVSATGAIITSAVSYLQGSADRAPGGTSYDHGSPYATWHTATYTLAQIRGFFAADSRTNVGALLALDLSHRGVSGRLISVTLYGANGTSKVVSGAVFIAVFNATSPAADPTMWSTLFGLAPIP